MNTSIENTAKKRAARTLRQIFQIPVLIGIISIVGLVSALVGDGPFDVFSWLALGTPCAVVAVFLWRQ